MESFKERVSYDELLNDYCSYYIQAFGQIEFEKIASKIQSSTKIDNFLKETIKAKVRPTATDFLAVIHSVLYFTFSKPEKISIASIILLSRWNKFVAIPNDLSDNIYLNRTFFNIIDKSNSFKFHLSSGDNFFEKFKSQSKIKYGKVNKSFNPPNVFSEMAYDAVVAHILEQDTLPKVGIFNCYLFYSTYISLLTSYVKINNTDNVDLYLAEGINELYDFLKLEVDDFYEFFNYDSIFSNDLIGGYVEEFSRLYINEFQKLMNYNFVFDDVKDFEIVLLFNTDEITQNTDLIAKDDFNLMNHLCLLRTNIHIINTKYDLSLSMSSSLKLEKWESKLYDFTQDDLFLDTLIVYPFRKSRCFICGDLTLREELKLKPYLSDGIFPMCTKCRNKN